MATRTTDASVLRKIEGLVHEEQRFDSLGVREAGGETPAGVEPAADLAAGEELAQFLTDQVVSR